MNDVLQWAAILVLATLALGLYRQIGLMLPANRRADEEGPPLGRRLPASVLDELANVLPGFKASGATVAFVAENCTGCHRLLSELNHSTQDLDGRLALIVKRPSRAFSGALRGIQVASILDHSGILQPSRRREEAPSAGVSPSP